MNGLCENSSALLQKRLHDLLKDIKDHSINQTVLFNDILPAFVDTSENTNRRAILSTYRDTGCLASNQSLNRYALQHYGSLGMTFLERILLQAQAALPTTKLALLLRLDNQSYDAPYEASDRLAILLGALYSHYGTTVVDNFLHPQFKQHIFIGKTFQQSPESNNVAQFENLIQSRGGSIDIDYEEVLAGWPLKFYGWNCSITYQLGHDTPYILHQRKGQNKKQAKLRVLHDIYNYYSRHNMTLIRHCNTSPGNHPHFRTQSNINQVNVTTLSIPTDQLYEYDDDRREGETLEELTSKRFTNPNIIDIPADTGTTNLEEEVSFLAQALLFDFNLDEALQPSPPASSPNQLPNPPSLTINNGAASPPKQSPVFRSEALTPVPTPVTYSITSPEKKHADHQPTDPNGSSHKNQAPPNLSASDVIVLPLPAASPSPTDQALLAKATELMDQLTLKERERLYMYGDRLRLQPNDSKGYLINLAMKFDQGYYKSAVEHAQLEKSRAYYIATVHFGTDAIKMALSRTSSKKTEAECKAAMAIFELLQTAAKQLNDQMALYY